DHLLSIVRTVGSANTVPAVALAMARASDFEGRLLAILEPDVPRRRLTRASMAAVAAAFLLVVMPLAAMSAERRAPGVLLAQNTKPDTAKSPSASTPQSASDKGPVRFRLSEVPVEQGLTGTVAALVETLGD